MPLHIILVVTSNRILGGGFASQIRTYTYYGMTTLKLLFSQKILKLAAVSLSAKDSRVLQELRFPVLRFRCHIPPPKLFWKFSRLRRFGHFGTCSILSCRRKWHNFAHNWSTLFVLWFGFMYQQLLVHVSSFGSMPTSPSAHKTLRT